MVDDPRLEKLKRLRASVVAASTARPDAKLDAYLDDVAHRAASITDAGVAELLAAGHTEDAIFESTVAAALGAAIERFEAGLRALEEAQKK